MNCIIIDDDSFYIEFLKNYCKKINLEVKGIYKDSVLALQEIDKLSDCDLIFLDINMPDITGFDILKYKPQTHVVITSADDSNAIQAFDYNVTDYLKKPFDFTRFMKAVNRVKEKIEEDQNTESHLINGISKTHNTMTLSTIFVNINKKLIKININDINVVEAKGDYVLMKLQGSENLIIHTTLKKLKEKLPEEEFFQVHRSFIVNLTKIVDIEESTVVIDREVIPISKGNRILLKEKLHILN
ncbi:LytR/AlgR family response regulator transcription factor [Lutibacter citreus]|uniref:LytR/AlgR family response regulator transcription factor n=1 Tax=Lutibacter citreus TaxID=2138210 RepID=UPI000DBE7B9E|nr:LytTR family DNA-binding domain-containing protein [Lutibacter citreus]